MIGFKFFEGIPANSWWRRIDEEVHDAFGMFPLIFAFVFRRSELLHIEDSKFILE